MRLRRGRHALILVALGAGALVFLATVFMVPALALVLGAITVFVVYLGLVGATLGLLTGAFLRANAEEADAPVTLIFAVVVAIVALCVASLFLALNGRGGPVGAEVALSIVSVLLGWFTIHTMASMHYAYEYYLPDGDEPCRGLDFVRKSEPGGTDFLYFGYTIGVAFAVSDVQASSTRMRELVLVHSTFAYFFNTLIVAATVNVAVAVGS